MQKNLLTYKENGQANPFYLLQKIVTWSTNVRYLFLNEKHNLQYLTIVI